MDAIRPTGPAVVNSANKAPGSTDRLSSDYETFLLMLTTQLENQDPTDPADADELAVQLATFSGVEQQTLTNDLLSSLLDQSRVTNLSQLGGWVGMEVLAPGPVGFEGTPIELALTVPNLADEAELVAYDSTGAVIHREAIDSTSETITWAGTSVSGELFPSGLYRFELEASRSGEPLQSGEVEAYRKVTEVRSDATGNKLTMAGGEQIDAGSVTALRAP